MKTDKQIKAKLIYNPRAGKKRQMLPNQPRITLEDIKDLLEQYQIPVDLSPTKHPGHAEELAKKAAKDGYKLILAAGGDGTVAEVATGLIGTDATLGILPMGTYMNIARMLSIPTEIEKAVLLLKIGRERKIDAAEITMLNGEKLKKPLYFFEEAGIGMEAQIHYYLTGIFERKEYQNILLIFKTIRDFYGHKVIVEADDDRIEKRLMMLTVSNGPYGWGAQPLAPSARLNDHRLTVKVYKMSRLELTSHLLKLLITGETPKTKKIDQYQVKTVKIITSHRRLFHADARIFDSTPVEIEVVPNALNVITGFPSPEAPKALNERTFLDY